MAHMQKKVHTCGRGLSTVLALHATSALAQLSLYMADESIDVPRLLTLRGCNGAILSHGLVPGGGQDQSKCSARLLASGFFLPFGVFSPAWAAINSASKYTWSSRFSKAALLDWIKYCASGWRRKGQNLAPTCHAPRPHLAVLLDDRWHPVQTRLDFGLPAITIEGT